MVQDWIRREIHTDKRRMTPEARRAFEVTGPRGKLALRLLQQEDRSGWLLVLQERVGRALVPDLPPRLGRLLDCLLTVDSEKQIARRLALSPHTVHEYAKQLYRRLDVSSRPELMARFVQPGS